MSETDGLLLPDPTVHVRTLPVTPKQIKSDPVLRAAFARYERADDLEESWRAARWFTALVARRAHTLPRRLGVRPVQLRGRRRGRVRSGSASSPSTPTRAPDPPDRPRPSELAVAAVGVAA